MTGKNDRDEPGSEYQEVRRPAMVQLDDGALIPVRNLIRPTPNRFTHEMISDEPYYFDRRDAGVDPAGVFPEGTLVVLLVRGDERSRVVDGAGLYVEVGTAALRERTGRSTGSGE